MAIDNAPHKPVDRHHHTIMRKPSHTSSKGIRFAGMLILLGLVWFGLLVVLLYDIYLRNSGHAQAASMWPIAQILGGNLAAVTGVVACAFVKLVRKLISLDTPTKPQ